MTNEESALIGALVIGGAVSAAIVIVMIILYIATCFGYGRMLKKAGDSAWKAYVPFYNLYIFYKLCWQPKMFWILLVASMVGSGLSNVEDNVILSLISIVFSIIAIVIEAKFCGRIARAYGRKTGTAIGLFFLPTIFSWILGLGSAQYTAPEEV